MNDNDRPFNLPALEQIETSMATLADIMASYYKSLVAKGVPAALAEDLCVELQELFFRGGRE